MGLNIEGMDFRPGQPIVETRRIDCTKCGTRLAETERNWCHSCRRVLTRHYSAASTPDMVSAGYPSSYWKKQLDEPEIFVVAAVETWPEVQGGRTEYSEAFWRQLYARGYAAIPNKRAGVSVGNIALWTYDPLVLTPSGVN